MNDNFGNGMNDDSFNVFNQNAEAYKQQQELLKQQAAQAQQNAIAQQQALANQHAQSLQQQSIQNIQDVDKNPSLFSFLGKKKEKTEERKFDINDPSTFDQNSNEKKPMDEKQKAKMEVILLIVLLVVLGVVGYWAFSVFMNTMGTNNKIDNSDSLIHEQNVKIGNYSCEKGFDYFSIPLPRRELINTNLSSYVIEYYSNDENKLVLKKEIALVHYQGLDIPTQNEILNYCNAYNNINDSYQVTCTLKNNVMTIANNFDLTKIDGKITNGDIVYDLGVDNNSLIKEVVNKESENGSKCVQLVNEG